MPFASALERGRICRKSKSSGGGVTISTPARDARSGFFLAALHHVGGGGGQPHARVQHRICGSRFHQCFCGHAGFIGGTMKTLESKRLSVDREIASPKSPVPGAQQKNSRSGDVALLPPTNGPPAKG
jgi:hypothetical protein